MNNNLSRDTLRSLIKIISLFLWDCLKSAPRENTLQSLKDTLLKVGFQETFVVSFVQVTYTSNYTLNYL